MSLAWQLEGVELQGRHPANAQRLFHIGTLNVGTIRGKANEAVER